MEKTNHYRYLFQLTRLAVILCLTAGTGLGESRRLPSQSPHSTGTPASFTPEMPFEQAIDIIRHATGKPLNIVVLWKDLANNADIYRDTAIGMDGISGVPLRTHLDLVLSAVAADNPVKLVYHIRQGVIVIGTSNTVRPKPVTRVYEISDLISPPANYFSPLLGLGFMVPMGGMQNMGMNRGFQSLGNNNRTLVPSM